MPLALLRAIQPSEYRMIAPVTVGEVDAVVIRNCAETFIAPPAPLHSRGLGQIEAHPVTGGGGGEGGGGGVGGGGRGGIGPAPSLYQSVVPRLNVVAEQSRLSHR